MYICLKNLDLTTDATGFKCHSLSAISTKSWWKQVDESGRAGEVGAPGLWMGVKETMEHSSQLSPSIARSATGSSSQSCDPICSIKVSYNKATKSVYAVCLEPRTMRRNNVNHIRHSKPRDHREQHRLRKGATLWTPPQPVTLQLINQGCVLQREVQVSLYKESTCHSMVTQCATDKAKSSHR